VSLVVAASSALTESSKKNVAAVCAADFFSRLRRGDATLWGPDAEPEASIRLGWTENPALLEPLVDEIIAYTKELHERGITNVVLCGMGGSSLGPEVMAAQAGVELEVVDATHPDQISRALSSDLATRVVVVASKSGTTVETDSHLRVFEQAFRDAGLDPLRHVVIVTDPNSPLHQASAQKGYRVFLGDPTIGGRFSALSAFGLVPTGLAGVDIASIVHDAAVLWEQLGRDDLDNPAVVLGVGISTGHPELNKILLRRNPVLPGFGNWVEQLVAESTGKGGVGLLPVVDSTLAPPRDCLVIGAEGSGADLVVEGSIGEQLLLWLYATAVAGFVLKLNPFDQPNVESAKEATRALLEGHDGSSQARHTLDGGSLWTSVEIPANITSVSQAATWATTLLGDRSYLALCIFGDRAHTTKWSAVRSHLEQALGRPVTLGFGPRFLHSTGQLHKGGAPEGVFLHIIESSSASVPIPGRDFDFTDLLKAQAYGDATVVALSGQPVVALELADNDSGASVVSALLEGR